MAISTSSVQEFFKSAFDADFKQLSIYGDGWDKLAAKGFAFDAPGRPGRVSFANAVNAHVIEHLRKTLSNNGQMRFDFDMADEPAVLVSPQSQISVKHGTVVIVLPFNAAISLGVYDDGDEDGEQGESDTDKQVEGTAVVAATLNGDSLGRWTINVVNVRAATDPFQRFPS